MGGWRGGTTRQRCGWHRQVGGWSEGTQSLVGWALGIHTYSYLCKHHHWKIYCKRPEGDCPHQAHDGAEEGLQHTGGGRGGGGGSGQLKCTRRQ